MCLVWLQLFILIIILVPVISKQGPFERWLFSFGPSPLTVALTMLPLSLDMPDTAFRWTARHPDLPRGPIDLGVVMHKPGMLNHEHVSTQGGDVEPGSLCVIAKPHNEVHILFNGPIFIQRTINIVDWY